MSNETVTRITADASGYTAELERATRSANQFLQSQDDAARRTAIAQQAIAEAATNGSNASTRSVNQFISSLTRQADTAGKTTAELLKMKAAQLGVSDAAASSIAKIEAAAAASAHGSEAAHSFSLNSTAARRELAVLAHEASQGSWQKLGGSMLVLAERTDALSLVMSPLGIALGVTAGAAFLFFKTIYEGSQQYDAFQKAITSTHGALGMTASDMIDVSNTFVDVHTSLSTAREALAAVASTGRFTGDDLALAGRAAIAMGEDTGESADKAVESLTRMHDNVLQWLATYQEQHHTFSAAQVEEIEGFVRAGDAAAAQKAVMLDLISAHESVAASAEKNIGTVMRWWNDWGVIIGRVKASIMDIGVPDSMTKQVGEQLARVEAAQHNVDQLKGASSFSLDQAKQQLAVETETLNTLRDQQAVQFKAARDAEKRAKGGDAAVAVNSYLNSSQYASPSDQRALAVRKENADYAAATNDLDKTSTQFEAAQKRHAANLQQIEKEFESRNGSKAAASAAAAAAQNAINAQLTALDAQDKAVESGLKTSIDHIKSLLDQGLITQEDALRQSHEARQKALADQLAIQQQEATIAEGKKQKSAIEKYAGEIAATRKKISDNDQQYTDDGAKLAAKRASDLKVYTDALQQQLTTQQVAADTTLAGLSMGSNDRADYDKQIALRQDYDRKVADLAKQQTEHRIGPDQYAAELTATQSYYDQSVAIAQKSSTDIRAANADWTTGAKRAIADYADQAGNVAASTAGAFQDAFKGMEDAFATFVTTGKISFSSLATSVLSDIARMQARAAISGLFSYAQSALGSYFGDSSPTASTASYGFHLATGGYVSGPGTATSDSIPAMLSDGEYVMKADAVNRIGLANLDAANSGRHVNGWQRFAQGGYVGNAASTALSGRQGDVTIAPQISVEGSADPAANQRNAGDLDRKITAAIRAVVVSERKQGGALWKLKNGV
ncbi:phage tail tape measure protein [Paraburkholderia dilworthii]|uniref:Phage tail tape measure protein n=1 Tax=Paraburkholderia dilworthii TaxID=948106 RepID=A0ABW9DA13_9BURK